MFIQASCLNLLTLLVIFVLIWKVSLISAAKLNYFIYFVSLRLSCGLILLFMLICSVHTWYKHAIVQPNPCCKTSNLTWIYPYLESYS